jgi:ubiquinone/menaquinone biosynthesis C-methylase UbiE
VPVEPRWSGIIPGLGLQKWLCKVLLRSRFLKRRIPRRPIAVDLSPSGTAEERWTVREARHRRGENTYNLFRDRMSSEDRMILDIGCGNGILAAMYARDGAFKVVGCDLSSASLQDGRAYIARRGLENHVVFILGNAAELLLAEKSFDLIVSDNTCEHIIGLERMLAHCYRVVKPGGYMCLKFSPWLHPAGFHLMDYIYIPYAHVFFGERALLEVLLEMAEKDPKIAESIPGLRKRPPPTSFVEMGMSPLSKVTVRQFRQMLCRTEFEVRYCHLQSFQKNARHSAMKAMLDLATKAPWLNEFLTSHIDCILQRPV